jgi:transcriptional regulator of heat shock response
MDISDRQQKLLLTIIKEFIESAEAVGSINLQNKYNFKVSPATIRNEMAELVGQGYLYKRNSSGGRIPTTKGWRYFIESLADGELDEIDNKTKNEILEDLNKIRADRTILLRHAIQHLSKLSNNIALALIDNQIYYAGLSDMVNIPEFRESNNLQNILKILEDYYTLSEILNLGNPANEINVLIGEETEISEFRDYAVVFSELRLMGGKKGYIAIVGPNRMRYDMIIPAIKYLTKILGDL